MATCFLAEMENKNYIYHDQENSIIRSKDWGKVKDHECQSQERVRYSDRSSKMVQN